MSDHVANQNRDARRGPGPRAREQAAKEPLWRQVVGGALRGERQAQGRTLKEVSETARISMPYLSEIERGRKEASSEVLAAAAGALGLSLADLLALTRRGLVPADRTARPEASATSAATLPVAAVTRLPRGTSAGNGPARAEVRLAA
ncbi:helix-turn-helix domain-containing protein [Streptomyces sp. NPDC058374]|uniref:helix-turn-helix domain-containing protein n=1 Tax=unclassified Streptomyces TaxID=2593676 RepID=UPI003665C707